MHRFNSDGRPKLPPPPLSPLSVIIGITPLKYAAHDNSYLFGIIVCNTNQYDSLDATTIFSRGNDWTSAIMIYCSLYNYPVLVHVYTY